MDWIILVFKIGAKIQSNKTFFLFGLLYFWFVFSVYTELDQFKYSFWLSLTFLSYLVVPFYSVFILLKQRLHSYTVTYSLYTCLILVYNDLCLNSSEVRLHSFTIMWFQRQRRNIGTLIRITRIIMIWCMKWMLPFVCLPDEMLSLNRQHLHIKCN